MKNPSAALDVRYRMTYCGTRTVPNMFGPDKVSRSAVVVIGSTVLAARARQEAERMSIAGYLLAQASVERSGPYTFEPESLHILGTREVQEEVCPSRK